MKFFLVVILVAALVAVLVLALLLALPHGHSNNLSVELENDSKVSVRRTSGGFDVKITYDSYLDRPSDAALFPDIVNELPTSHTLDESFWDRLSRADQLSEAERVAVIGELVSRRFINEAMARTLLAQLAEDAEAGAPAEPGGDHGPELPFAGERPFEDEDYMA